MLLRLCLLAALAGLLSGQFIGRPPPGYYDYSDFDTNPSQCSTHHCNNMAGSIQSKMDSQRDPCDDFYDYACGNSNHRFRIDEGQYSSLIEEAYDENMLRSVYQLNSVEDNNQKFPHAVRFMAKVFRQCEAAATWNEEKQWSAVEQVYHYLFRNAGNHSSWIDLWIATWEQFENKVFFDIQLGPGDDPNRNYVHIFPARLNIDPLEKKFSSPNVNFAMKLDGFLSAIAKIICVKQLSADICKQEDINHEVLSMIRMEEQLAGARGERLGEAKIEKMELSQLSEESGIDFHRILSEIFRKSQYTGQIDPKLQIYVQDREYFKSLNGVLASVGRWTVIYYFGLQAIAGKGSGTPYAELVSEQFREQDYSVFKVFKPPGEHINRQQFCMNLVEKHFNEPMIHLAAKSAMLIDILEKISVIRDDIKMAMIGMMNETWVDPATRQKMTAKIKDMNVNVGTIWQIHDPKELDKRALMNKEIFDQLMAVDNFAIALRMYEYMRARKNFHLFDGPLVKDDDSWPGDFLNAKILYNPKTNTLTLPMSVVRPPLFSIYMIPGHSYGIIGGAIANKMAYLLNPYLPQYANDSDIESASEWRSAQVKEKLTTYGSCLEKQYSEKYDSKAKLNLDGTQTLNENLADGHGLAAAYKAFMITEDRTGTLSTYRALPTFTSPKIFFISWAQQFCNHAKDGYLHYQIMLSDTAPGRYRANVPLMNFKPFRDTFNCAVNANKTCTLW